MKIDTKQPILNLQDKPIVRDNGEEITLGEVLADIVLTTENRSATALKLRVLAEKFYKESEVDLDDADLNLVKEIVKASKTYTVLVLGYVEKILG